MLRVDKMEEKGRLSGAIFMGLAHCGMDIYQNVFPVLGPLVIPLFALNFTQVGLITTLFMVTSSVTQPILGHISDKGPGKWFLVGGMAWTPVFMALIGFSPNYLALLGLVGVAGLGSAAFHPQAAALAWAYGGRRKGTAMSIFMGGANLGLAIGPPMTAMVLLRTGLTGTYWLAIPGLLMSLALFVLIPGKQFIAQKRKLVRAPEVPRRPAYMGLGLVSLVITFRAWTHISVVVFLPLYFIARQVSLSDSSLILTVFLVAGAVGGLAGGYISDVTDRKLVTIVSMLAAAPLFLAFLLTSGPISLTLLALTNFALMAAFSVNITMSQEMLPGREALAGGLSLGLAMGMGGIAAMLTGMISDRVGLSEALFTVAALPAVAGLLGVLIPRIPGGAVDRPPTEPEVALLHISDDGA